MESLRGQEQIWQLMFSFVDSMALKCAIELRIADIIHSHGKPITLSQIASGIRSNSNSSISPNIPYLSRIMRFLVRKNIFTEHQEDNDEVISLYGLSDSSRWLLRDFKSSLAPMVLMQTHPLSMAVWHFLEDYVRNSSNTFEKAHGCNIWEFSSANPEFNKIFNNAMASIVPIYMGAMLSSYKDGLGCIKGTVVDVGGGTGGSISELMKYYPNIKGINFDLPHVIATAPALDGVTHISGDIFESIPSADAVLMKGVLHCFSDEKCVKVLRNCRKAITDKKNGKIIILEIVLDPTSNQIFDETRMVYDLLIPLFSGGKERTELEWKRLLNEAGFTCIKITKIPIIPAIIEAFLV
ncbi:desmethylxanthohumol 6'-O-methyltransferase [Humulus lupulus]|uniref:desmethylxanthohumol 6'-O-methyltransferase n=1 Tax=Humulus lupulus TaxID=3486 RepID=UPI0001819D3B|nr:desmethylxanthohumol 6'-O-methyltransferase [Humulus lupulus]CAQ58423.1 O-methyltransferase [Humulus lupulus]